MMPTDDNAPRVQGVYAALITPVDERGRPAADELMRLLDFVVEQGVDGVCLGGGTAEYPHFSLNQRKTIVATAARHLDQRVPFVTAIGAPTVRDVLDLGTHALDHGSQALLLPMPFFYRYEQPDLAAYARAVAQMLAAPCLLYNLAAFTNPLQPATTIDLLRTEPHVVGLKDSSGNPEALIRLAAERGDAAWSLLCGSDGRALDALEAGWDGIISGIASCCPEVVVALYRSHRAGRAADARRCQELLDALAVSVERLPFPWSIRVAADVRGFASGPLPLPVAPERREEIARLRTFYEDWFARHLPELHATITGEEVAR